MNVETHHLKIGAFKCMIVNDGNIVASPFPPNRFFANAPTKQLHQVLQQHGIEPDRCKKETSLNCLAIDTGKHRILVDTGLGTSGLAPDAGNLLDTLVAEGMESRNIDTVILTHGHFDHIAGLTDINGDLAFPNARYMMWKTEWDYWNSEANLVEMDEMWAEVTRRNLPPIQEKVHLIDAESEILPGVQAGYIRTRTYSWSYGPPHYVG